MLKNYFFVAIRSIKKARISSIINILGLAIAISAFIMLSIYINNDVSYDKFNKNYKSIYRVNQQFNKNGESSFWSLTPSGYAGALCNEFPGLQAARILIGYKPVVKYGDKLFTTSDFIFSDASLFKIFSLPLIEGDPNTALNEPFSIVLSQTEARKLFGKTNPIGKIIHVNSLFDYKVTGVAADAPINSTIQFKYIAPFNNIKDFFRQEMHWDASDNDIFNNFSAANFFTFILLPNGNEVNTINNQLPAFIYKYCGARASKMVKLHLQPLGDIHFNSTYQFDFPNKANINNDYILGAIAFFILLIACVNFINILTAQASKRTKEIGLRKVLGASRGRIILQFIIENIAFTSLAVSIALGIIYLLTPSFNSLTGKSLSANPFTNSSISVIILLTWLFVIIMTCIYPAFYLSSFQPASIIKNNFNRGKKYFSLKKSLIVFQFAFSVFLIIATLIVLQQYSFIKSFKTGFEKEQVIYIPINSQITNNFESFRTQLLQKPNISFVSRANWVPGNPQNIENYSWVGKTGILSDGFYSSFIEQDYAQALGFEFVSGRNFSRNMPSDITGSYIINETAAKKMGWTANEAIGKTIDSPNHGKKQVVGVIKDFIFTSLHQKVDPVVMSVGTPEQYQMIVIKTNPRNISQTINDIGEQWKNAAPSFPFDYHFMDQEFANMYQSEERLSRIVTLFSGLSILIASLGLLGVISHSTLERTKEIGIRKVSGATVNNIVFLLTKEYAVLVIIANLVAYPFAYYFMSNWLEDFAYRIDINFGVFILSGIIALLFAMFIVSFHAIKAAVANPIESLKYE